MGAAIGAGCRVCAENLYEITVPLDIPLSHIRESFNIGPEAKLKSAKKMKDTYSALGVFKKVDDPEDIISDKLLSLILIESLTAANSAPDVILEIYRARAQGASPTQIQMCIALGRMVRKNAIFYSDQEISGGNHSPRGRTYIQ